MILIIKKTGKAIREMVYLVIRSAVPPELSLSRCFSFLLLLIVSARDIKGGGRLRAAYGYHALTPVRKRALRPPFRRFTQWQ
jgi:hypothetical protein